MIRVAFVTTYDARDIRYWSGTPYYMAQALMRVGLAVSYIGPLRKMITPPMLARWGYHHYISHLKHDTEREPFVSKGYARQIEKYLRKSQSDVILCPGTVPISQLDTQIPIVIWTDATFDGMINYYPEWTDISQSTLRNGHTIEQKALSRCSLAVYASDWARQTAITHYKVNPDRIKVVPFGANFDFSLSSMEVRALIEKRPKDKCRLMFIGQDWHRKGGDMAIAVAEQLRTLGQDVELNLVGCAPPVPLPPYAVPWGFVSKATADGRARLRTLYGGSHFCLIPSRAECLGIAIAEAASFGVPTIATNVGGIPTAVNVGRNGVTFPLEDFVSEAALYIQRLRQRPEEYQALAESAHKDYEERLNWGSSASTIKHLLETTCS